MNAAVFSPRLRHALWLLPPPTCAGALAQVNAWLCARHHGLPCPSHLTLTSGLTGDLAAIISTCGRLLARQPALAIDLRRLVVGGTAFAAVLAEARPTPALLRLRRRLRRAWGLADEPFAPHLSLWYGDPGPQAEAALAALRGRLPVAGFRCRAVELWRIQGPPAQWGRVARWRLGGLSHFIGS